ncbi:MotA/TolQ/ExbB proton channel family protein [Roseiconus lacunae]|uniref:MotA/TolQ/ExbB proton channel family protein n=1 Tax=Roseiconus lacunae TaxID=2605694 RepID=A0ABT7PGJ3_9BACT|nr:MotA/TolQ/ExbB proton channel family protein [Roseiconus lacunae]MDM4015614.1 MotA/TolQ/ExbB proton channel family protein [Roseiconus lacunae]
MPRNPYQTSSNDDDHRDVSDAAFEKRKQILKRMQLVSGVVFLIAVVFAVAGTTLSMMAAFRQLSTQSSVDPTQLAAGISRSLRFGAIGIPIAVIAFLASAWARLTLRHEGLDD